MATFKGSDGVVKAGASGSENAIGEIRNFSVEETADTIEDTSMGDTSRTYKDSLKSFTASIDALFDDTDTAQTAMTIGSELSFLFLPEGATTGDYQLSGSGIVTSVSRSQSYDGLVEISFSVQGSGALTIGTAS
jgi:hypothetical protein|tara:strand:- start:169 stop:570 length:402 start_codon:yes stop_codon:yes gene_type:complete